MNKYHLAFTTLLAIGLSGCSHNHNHEGGDTHGHIQAKKDDHHNHDENFQFTVYNDVFEVYMHVTPLAAGHESRITAHLTRLENFKPLERGNITLSLLVGDKKVYSTAKQPVRPGIYLFTLKPEVAGTAQIELAIDPEDGLGTPSRVVVPHATVYDDMHTAQHAAVDALVEVDNSVGFPKEQSWKTDFATEQVIKAPFGRVVRTTARVASSPDGEMVISSKYGGIAVFSDGTITEGREVTAGQPLLIIESGNLADNNLLVIYREAQAEYERAKAEYGRKKELAADKIVSESDLLRARTDLINAQANYEQLSKNFAAGKQVISSPISGFIRQVLVRNGQYAETGQPVLVVSRNSDLLIKAELPPRYYESMRDIATANIRIMNTGNTYSLEELGGKLVAFGRSAETDNPLIPVTFKVNHTAGLFPGSFVEMFMVIQAVDDAITIPNEALIEEMSNYFAFVQITPEYFEKRPVKKGVTDGRRTEITAGINPGERVVTKGAMMLKLSQAAGAIDPHSGHAH